MSNANTPAMMAQSMAESLFRENARLKKIEESYYRLLELDSGDVMVDTLNELDRLRAEVASLKEQNALLAVQGQRVYAAADAVVRRWDTPLWKDVPHTAEFIYALRDALTALPQQVRIEDDQYCQCDEPLDFVRSCGKCGKRFAPPDAAISAQENKS